MKKDRIFLSEPHFEGDEGKYLSKKYLKGRNYNHVADFEKDIEIFLKNDSKAVGLSSGTTALHMSLILAGVREGDEVICQTFTFSASVFPIRYQRAIPIFIDSEKDTWNMCPKILEEAIKDRISKGKKPKAIIVVHLFGMPAKMNEIIKISKKYSIALIEDAAEALGASFKEHYCGTFGDFGVLSFNTNKIITALGGGMLICKNEEIKNKAIFYSTQAKDKLPYYQHSRIGYNYRMSNAVAAIGIGQMKVLQKRITERRKNNFFYKNIINKIEGVELLTEPNENYFSNHWLTSIIIEKNIVGYSNKDLKGIFEKENIETRFLWKPMHLQPIFSNYAFYGGDVAEILFQKGLCLPSSSNLTIEDKKRISNIITRF